MFSLKIYLGKNKQKNHVRLEISGGSPYTKEYFKYFQDRFKNYYYIPVSDKVSIFKIHFLLKKIKCFSC